MKRLIMISILSIFFIIGNNTANGLGKDLNEPVTQELGEGFPFGKGMLDVDLGLQFGSLVGNTTYDITFDGGESKLEFPLGTYLLGLNFGWGYKNEQNQEKVKLDIKWLTNVGDGNGIMKDSDWIDDDESFLTYYGIVVPSGYNHPGLDIYSESEIKLKATIIDINVVYNFWPNKNISIGPMAGYRYQSYKFKVSNTEQIGYDLYAPFTASVRGATLEYKVNYYIPYFGLNSNLQFGRRFKTNLSFGYAPWASAKDKDDHLLRDKLSKAETDGYAYLANLNLDWNFMTHFYFSIGSEYLKIHTTGTQHQPTADVDDKITSWHWSIYEMITYRF